MSVLETCKDFSDFVVTFLVSSPELSAPVYIMCKRMKDAGVDSITAWMF